MTSKSLAPLINKGEQTLNNWRSQGIPERDSVRAHVSAFMEKYDSEKIAEIATIDVINLEVSPEKFDQWNRASLEAGLIIRDWAIQGLDRMAREEFAKVTDFPKVAEDEATYHAFTLPFYGAAAAGSQVTSQIKGDTLTTSKKYPAGYFIIEVNGQSMEPTLPDGSRIICEPKEYTPKNGKICIISDGHGSSVKRYDGKRKVFVSDNPEFPDFTPVDEVKLQGYFVEVLPS